MIIEEFYEKLESLKYFGPINTLQELIPLLAKLQTLLRPKQ
jgi:hypothetical protein